MTEKEKMIRAYVDAYNRFDIAGMLTNLDENIRFVNSSGGIVNTTLDGIDQFKEAAEKAKHLFSERTQTITAWRFDDDVVEITIRYHAVLAADLAAGMKQGDKLNLEGRSVFRFSGNKIMELTDIS